MKGVVLALKVPVDLIEADIGAGASVVVDLHVPADHADSGVAGSRVVLALEIAADLDAGAVEAALLQALLIWTLPPTVTAPSRSAKLH